MKRKYNVLIQLTELTETQKDIIDSNPMDEKQFNSIITEKENLIQKLNELDQGFDQIYQKVKDVIQQDKDQYKAYIEEIKSYILRVTDCSVKLQALEKRNKAKLESVFTLKRKEIKMSKASNLTATNYYKTMAKQHEEQSFFYDKKN